jgi:hypothetical protein
LRDHEPELREKGVSAAAIGLGDRLYARAFREESKIPFPLLIDERREAYRAAGLKRASLLHIFKKENRAARGRARDAGHRQHKLGKDPLQLGGTFVFGPGDVDRFVHLSETFGDNAPPEAWLPVIR